VGIHTQFSLNGSRDGGVWDHHIESGAGAAEQVAGDLHYLLAIGIDLDFALHRVTGRAVACGSRPEIRGSQCRVEQECDMFQLPIIVAWSDSSPVLPRIGVAFEYLFGLAIIAILP
jgi:hypothetical protein